MGICSGCNKESTMLFNEKGEMLCWLCSSKRKVKAREKTSDAREKEYEERRVWIRYPVQMHLKFYYGQSEKSKIIFPGVTVNVSLGGLCVEWTPCQECSGYQAGSVHPNCIFSRYNAAVPDSEVLMISLFMSETDVVNVQGKIVFVIRKEDGREYIGISFCELDSETKKRLELVINQVVPHGETEDTVA